jgi:hypothetical protein
MSIYRYTHNCDSDGVCYACGQASPHETICPVIRRWKAACEAMMRRASFRLVPR